MSWDLDEEGKEGLRPKLSPMSWIDEHQSDLFNKSTNLVRMDCKIHVLHPPIRVCHISILQIITHEWISNVTHNHNSPKPKSSHFLSDQSTRSSTSCQILPSSMEMAPKLSKANIASQKKKKKGYIGPSKWLRKQWSFLMGLYGPD